MRNRRVLSWASVAVCFLLVPSALLAGDGHVRHTGHTPIAGQYIIRFEPGQDAASLANRLVTRFGGEIYYVFNGDPILGATIRGISEAIASAISADPSVMDVEQDSDGPPEN